MMDSKIAYSRLNPPERTLLGPDLSNPSPRARQGLIAILEGANDPSFLKVLDEALALLRHLWGTGNEDTFIIPGVEENALEAALVNLLQPGDTCVVVVNGFFGERMALAAERLGADVVRLRAEPGKAVTSAAIEAALRQQPVKVLAVLHGDGATGVEQPLSGLGELARAHDALLLVDARWTLGALPLAVNELGIDACIAGSQKALSAYPGLGLLTFSPRAAEAHTRRQHPVQNWLYDLEQLRRWRDDDRAAQTLPAPIVYALTEMLQLTYEQGMTYRIERHINRRDALVAGLEALGLSVYADPAYRLPTVTAVNIPVGIDQERVRDRLRVPYRIDIGGGLDDLHGKVWRIGIMSHSAQPTFLLAFLTLFEVILGEEGFTVSEPGAAVRALLARLDP
jgi:alanine-glyoxylate transaminase / serine-glyoxylate transaminase / serine-pyruvate transaminase